MTSDAGVAHVYDDGEHVAVLTNPELVPEYEACGWFDVEVADAAE